MPIVRLSATAIPTCHWPISINVLFSLREWEIVPVQMTIGYSMRLTAPTMLLNLSTFPPATPVMDYIFLPPEHSAYH